MADAARRESVDASLRSEAGAKTVEQINYRRDAFGPPSGKIPDPKKKEYCTHWILHGDCAYVQQGCRYKHEMPDKSKLAEIGVRNTPRWWQEQNFAFKFGEKAIAGQRKSVSEWFRMRPSSASSGDESESRGNEKLEETSTAVIEKLSSDLRTAHQTIDSLRAGFPDDTSAQLQQELIKAREQLSTTREQRSRVEKVLLDAAFFAGNRKPEESTTVAIEKLLSDLRTAYPKTDSLRAGFPDDTSAQLQQELIKTHEQLSTTREQLSTTREQLSRAEQVLLDAAFWSDDEDNLLDIAVAKFDGTEEKVEPFIKALWKRFFRYPHRYPNDDDQLAYTAGRLEGVAQKTFNAYITTDEETGKVKYSDEINTPSKFFKAIRRNFGDKKRDEYGRLRAPRHDTSTGTSLPNSTSARGANDSAVPKHRQNSSDGLQIHLQRRSVKHLQNSSNGL